MAVPGDETTGPETVPMQGAPLQPVEGFAPQTESLMLLDGIQTAGFKNPILFGGALRDDYLRNNVGVDVPTRDYDIKAGFDPKVLGDVKTTKEASAKFKAFLEEKFPGATVSGEGINIFPDGSFSTGGAKITDAQGRIIELKLTTEENASLPFEDRILAKSPIDKIAMDASGRVVADPDFAAQAQQRIYKPYEPIPEDIISIDPRFQKLAEKIPGLTYVDAETGQAYAPNGQPISMQEAAATRQQTTNTFSNDDLPVRAENGMVSIQVDNELQARELARQIYEKLGGSVPDGGSLNLQPGNYGVDVSKDALAIAGIDAKALREEVMNSLPSEPMQASISRTPNMTGQNISAIADSVPGPPAVAGRIGMANPEPTIGAGKNPANMLGEEPDTNVGKTGAVLGLVGNVAQAIDGKQLTTGDKTVLVSTSISAGASLLDQQGLAGGANAVASVLNLDKSAMGLSNAIKSGDVNGVIINGSLTTGNTLNVTGDTLQLAGRTVNVASKVVSVSDEVLGVAGTVAEVGGSISAVGGAVLAPVTVLMDGLKVSGNISEQASIQNELDNTGQSGPRGMALRKDSLPVPDASNYKYLPLAIEDLKKEVVGIGGMSEKEFDRAAQTPDYLKSLLENRVGEESEQYQRDMRDQAIARTQTSDGERLADAVTGTDRAAANSREMQDAAKAQAEIDKIALYRAALTEVGTSDYKDKNGNMVKDESLSSDGSVLTYRQELQRAQELREKFPEQYAQVEQLAALRKGFSQGTMTADQVNQQVADATVAEAKKVASMTDEQRQVYFDKNKEFIKEAGIEGRKDLSLVALATDEKNIMDKVKTNAPSFDYDGVKQQAAQGRQQDMTAQAVQDARFTSVIKLSDDAHAQVDSVFAEIDARNKAASLAAQQGLAASKAEGVKLDAQIAQLDAGIAADKQKIAALQGKTQSSQPDMGKATNSNDAKTPPAANDKNAQFAALLAGQKFNIGTGGQHVEDRRATGQDAVVANISGNTKGPSGRVEGIA